VTSRAPSDQVGLATLVAYGLLGLPLAAATLPLYIHLPNYYAADLGLGLAAVGAVLFGMRLWDVVTDPLVGVLSDRYGGGIGRRKLWVMLGLPVAMIGGWMIFRPPVDADLTYLLIAGLILHLGWTMVTLPYHAWGAEISGDYHVRNRVTASREIFVIVGTVVAGGLTAAAGDPETRAEALGMVALFLVVGLPLCAAPLLWKVPDPKGKNTVVADWRGAVSRIRRNRPFRRLILAWLLNGVANGLPATLFIIYVEVRLGLPEQSGLFLLAYFLVAVIGMPGWLLLARRIGKHKAWCVAMIWACGWFALAPWLGQGDFWLYMALVLATGLALGADLILPPSMQADVVDVDTAQGGAARTGVYFALWGMATKLSLALAVGIAFPLLDWAGLDPTAGAAGNDPAGSGSIALGLLYGALPIAFKVAAIVVMWRHPLDEAAQEALRERIERSRRAPE
jgi:GPH family glycoside/pentoside/hexuronide:cation symporter